MGQNRIGGKREILTRDKQINAYFAFCYLKWKPSKNKYLNNFLYHSFDSPLLQRIFLTLWWVVETREEKRLYDICEGDYMRLGRLH